MKRKVSYLDIDRLHEVLDYDPLSGRFTWRVMLSPRGPVGNHAGSFRKDGYRRIAIDGVQYVEHHLAWLHHYGSPPETEIDHINLLKGDNRIANLRPATRAQNAQNQVPTSGALKGVSRFTNGRYRALIRFNGNRLYLGSFATAEEAYAAYCAKAEELHGKFMRLEMSTLETRRQIRDWAASQPREVQNLAWVLRAQLRVLDQCNTPLMRETVALSMARMQAAAT